MATEPVPARTPEREQFYDRIAPANLAPLWENLHRMVTPEPVPSCVPAIWYYRDVRPHLLEPGDFVITPSWTWHDHGNETSEPMVWLDGLDIQIVKLLGASFAEGYPDAIQPVSRPEGDSFARFGQNLLPVDWKPEVKTSPVFNYPYSRTREALDALCRNGAPDPYHGYKLRYVNPASGEFAMPTIATFVQLMPAGFASQPYRSTDGTVFVVVEGKGETRIGDKTFAWEPHDIFVVPSWMTHTHPPGSEV